MSDSELKSRILYLHDALRKLSDQSKHARATFLDDYTISDTVLHNFQVAIEAITDIGNYILKRGNHKIPETRGEVFELLCRHGYLDSSTEQSLAEMSKFRNLLVHGYAAVNLEIVYDILQTRLDFLKQVAVQLAEKSEKE
ncbi:MAG: DUF86 domain-containing protein [Candidatus Thorarchaeota archaeon]|nr:DUF86 domain-containing protein [Candidatus Thorarchaeota archaeon]